MGGPHSAEPKRPPEVAISREIQRHRLAPYVLKYQFYEHFAFAAEWLNS